MKNIKFKYNLRFVTQSSYYLCHSSYVSVQLHLLHPLPSTRPSSLLSPLLDRDHSPLFKSRIAHLYITLFTSAQRPARDARRINAEGDDDGKNHRYAENHFFRYYC